MNTNTIVKKFWNHCNILRDDGISYGDYVEQLADHMQSQGRNTPFMHWELRGKVTQTLLNGRVVYAEK